MKWTRRASAKDSTRGRRRFSLQVEPLEGRALLAAAATVSQVLVAEDYQVFLGRQTDPAGLAFWSAKDPSTFGAGIANSAESATNFVTHAYQQFLGRTPEQAGLNSWLGQLNSGRTPDQVEAGILGSQEYFAKGLNTTNQGFLTNLYQDVLNRPPDASGNAFWLNALSRGVSRTTVAFDFVSSSEAAGTQVTNYYQGILGRGPDPAGLSSWTTALAGPKPSLAQQQVVVAFINSTENISRVTAAIAAAPAETTADQVAASLLTTIPGLPIST